MEHDSLIDDELISSLVKPVSDRALRLLRGAGVAALVLVLATVVYIINDAWQFFTSIGSAFDTENKFYLIYLPTLISSILLNGIGVIFLLGFYNSVRSVLNNPADAGEALAEALRKFRNYLVAGVALTLLWLVFIAVNELLDLF